MRKVVLITEYLNPPYDEGIKKTVFNLYLDLDKNYELKVICRYGFKKDNIHIVVTNPLYFSSKIRSLIREFNPDSMIYLPFQSSTFASYVRLKIFSILHKKNRLVFVALQPKPLKSWQNYLVQMIKPEIALTPSPSLKQYWDSINVKNDLIPLLTDLTVFKPISNKGQKEELRKKYNIQLDAFIISHMGHLNEGRNLKSLIPLQKAGLQVVIVSSSSTPDDAKGEDLLKKELLDTGIRIVDSYIDHIEEIYQLSDVYIFPVIDQNSSIGMPLSILEARACGIPVITTNYGSVESFLKDDYGSITYSETEDFLDAVMELKSVESNYHKTNVNQLNKLFFEAVHNKIEK